MKGKKLVATKSLNEVNGMTYDLISTKSLNAVNGVTYDLISTKSLSEVNEINHMHCLKKRRNWMKRYE